MYIRKVKAANFKKFANLSIEFSGNLNILVGDNEAGKSSILLAIDLLLSGSRNKVEAIGLEALFNSDSVSAFLKRSNKYEDLPTLFIELYFSEMNNPELNGKNNSDGVLSDGLVMTCVPRDDLSKEIVEVLSQKQGNFPFEYYSISFKTFSGETYSGYKKVLKHLLLDSALINNEHATKTYIKHYIIAVLTIPIEVNI